MKGGGMIRFCSYGKPDIEKGSALSDSGSEITAPWAWPKPEGFP